MFMEGYEVKGANPARFQPIVRFRER
jgi:hypothetical protein